MARKFFYTCAGMLMLALSYHLGARDAAGQSIPVIEATSYDNGAFFAVFSGAWNQIDTHTGSVLLSYPLPVQAPVAGTGNDLVLYKNGDLYIYDSAWVLKGNVFGGPTPALHESWGQVKSRYATPPATPGMTTTPGASNR